MTIRRRHSSIPPTLAKYSLVFALSFSLAAAVSAAGGITLDGSLGASGSVHSGTVNVNGVPTTTTYLISYNLGQIRGANLFHSFGTFNIGKDESATFTGPGSITNIIGRVTGGNPSSIDGLIRSTIGGANLFLLNPSGVMFGPNASLDVSGSFHVSTADYLKLGDGGVFYANPNLSSVLSAADPMAFGFLSSNSVAISLDQAVLKVPAGKTLSIIGGDINARNDPDEGTYFDYDNSMPGSTFYLLSAPGGRINLVSVASPGEVNLGAADLGIGSFAKLGSITFTNGANLTVASDNYATGPVGSIFIRGGQLLFRDASIEASGNPAGMVDIKGESLNLDNFSIYLINGETDHPGTAFLADISRDFTMTNASLIDTSTVGSGRAGGIRINADNIKLGNDTHGTGPYVDYGIYGAITSLSSGSSGRGGDISISSGNLTVQNGFYINTASTEQASGDAGNITIHADTLRCLDQGQIVSNTLGIGNGGIVRVIAHDIIISASNSTSVANLHNISGIGANVFSSGNGGKILLNADNLQIKDGGQISTYKKGTGIGADIEVNAKNVTVSGFLADSGLTPKPYVLSAIDARVSGADATGRGGNITITTDSLKLKNAGVIRTGLYSDAPGHAGNISINAGSIDIASRGQIYADSFRGTGTSGDMNIRAKSLNITGAGNSPRPIPLDFDFTGLSTSTNAGRGGTIAVALTGDLALTSGGGIKAGTQGIGTGGAIGITAQNVLLSDAASINASSTGIGNAGNIDIKAADSLMMRNSSITTEARLADGGNIRIAAPNKISVYDSKITASVGGGKLTTGGNITIDPQYVILKNGRIVANAFEGNGGNIAIAANTFLADPQSVVDASSAMGVSGTVDIRATISNISGLLTPLSSDIISASALLRERCIARIRAGKYSSFVVGGRDGLPIEPGNLLPSLPY